MRVLTTQVELLSKLISQTENRELRSGLVSGLALHLHAKKGTQAQLAERFKVSLSFVKRVIPILRK